MNSPRFAERLDRLNRDYESASLFPEMFNVSEHAARAAIEMLIFPLNPVGSLVRCRVPTDAPGFYLGRKKK